MSRAGGDDYEEEFAGQSALWQANSDRAMNGKRGRKALAELREALLALPERRLIANACSTVGEQPIPVADEAPRWLDPGYLQHSVALQHNELLAEQGEGLCSVAAYAWHQRVKAGADPQQAMADLPLHPDYDDGANATTNLGIQAGLSSYVAWELMWLNDEHHECLTPEARWVAVMEWLDRKLGAPADA